MYAPSAVGVGLRLDGVDRGQRADASLQEPLYHGIGDLASRAPGGLALGLQLAGELG